MFGSFFGKPIVECLSVSRNSAFACDRDLLRKKRGGEEEDRFVTRGKERRRRETLKMLEQESDRDGSSSESQKLKTRKGMLLPRPAQHLPKLFDNFILLIFPRKECLAQLLFVVKSKKIYDLWQYSLSF